MALDFTARVGGVVLPAASDGLAAGSPALHNNARFLFLDPAAREFYHDWER